MSATVPAAAGREEVARATSAAPPCLIVNPRSFSASRGLAAKAAALARVEGAEVITIDSPEGLCAAIEQILVRRQAHVMVLAGDGTVCAIVDQLAKLPPGSWTPDLLVLPGGRTNLTAADLCPGGQALPIMTRALQLSRHEGWAQAIEERCPLRIEQDGMPARHGFFIAGALIDGVIRQCHQRRLDRRGDHPLSTPFDLLWLGVRALFGRAGLSCPVLRVDAEGCGVQQGAFRLLLVTTLMHRTGFFNPYASRGQGEVRVTAVTREALGFWRSLPRLLSGRFTEAMSTASGYLSGRCGRLEIRGLTTYMLDGEACEADPAGPLVVTAGPRLRFFKS